MELEQIKGGLTGELIDQIKRDCGDVAIETFIKQYRPQDHDVMDKAKRQDKLVNSEQGTTSVPVNRIPIPFQKRIVSMAATFLCGNPITLEHSADEGTEEDLVNVLQKIWDDNKLDYASKKLAKLMMSETEAAELWYTEEADSDYWEDTAMKGKKFRFRMKVLANSLGDALYPVFNSFGDMIAFGRGYTVKVGAQQEEHFDLYTDDKIFLGARIQGNWEIKAEKNIIGKIPVIYYSQPLPEWHDVQWLIDRQEKSMSNHADTNDYNGSPTILVRGTITGFAKKGEQGKVLELDNDANAEYMSWDHAPESVKMEQENNERLIYEQTSTPNISFEKMQKLGGHLTNFGVKMMFMDAHMKASEKEEIFGEGVQRRINYLKHAAAVIHSGLKPALKLPIKPRFEYFLPKNDVEKVETLVQAKVGGIISVRSAVAQNPLVSDLETELDEIKKDGLNNQMNNEF